MATKKPPKNSKPVKRDQILRQAQLRTAATAAARSTPSKQNKNGRKDS